MDCPTLQHIRNLDRNNLMKFLKDRDYIDIAAILKQKDIDGKRFLDLTELDLVQWQLSPRQQKLILNCRDEIADAHPEKNKETLTMPKKTPHVTSRLNTKADFFQELESKLCMKQIEGIQRTPPNSTLPGYVDMTTKSLKTHHQSQVTNLQSVGNPSQRLWPKVPTQSINIQTKTDLLEKPSKNVDKSTGLPPKRSLQLPYCRNKQNEMKPLNSDVNFANGEEDSDDEDNLIPNPPPEHPYRPPKHKSNNETSRNVGINVTICPPPSLAVAKNLETHSENEYEDEPKLVSRVPELHNHKCMPDVPPRPSLVKQGALPKPPQFTQIFEKSELSLVKTLMEEETSDLKKEFNPNDCQFYRNTDRNGARELLLKIPYLANGVFVLRNSDDYFLALTIYYQNHFYNVAIHRHENGYFYCKTQIGNHVVLFKTLEQFVEYYKIYPITLMLKESQINICLREQLLPLDIY